MDNMEEFLDRYITVGMVLTGLIAGIVGFVGLKVLIKLVDFLIKRSETKATKNK